MRIAMVGHKRVPSREGGIEVVVEELAARMVVHGHAVTCYNRSGHHVSGREYDAEHLDEYRGIRLRHLPTIDRKGLAAVTSSFFGCLAAAFGPYDVVHIHAEGPAMFSWIPRLTGKRVILTIHGLDWARDKWKGSFGSWYIRMGEKIGARYAHEIIVLNHGTQKYFLDTYGRTTHYIPNGVNPAAPVPADIIREKYGLEKDSYILYLGRMVPEKGCHYLVDAFKKLDTDKKLVIAGGSSDTQWYMDKLKEQAGGDERVIFTGFVDGALREELYSNACLFVLPSDLEGMPLCLLEAMSYGNCVITSDIEECTNVIHDNGISFRKSDVDDLAQKLTYALSHPQHRPDVQVARRRVRLHPLPVGAHRGGNARALREKIMAFKKAPAAFAAGAFLFSANFSASGGHARRAARPRSPARSAPAKTPRSGAAAF